MQNRARGEDVRRVYERTIHTALVGDVR